MPGLGKYGYGMAGTPEELANAGVLESTSSPNRRGRLRGFRSPQRAKADAPPRHWREPSGRDDGPPRRPPSASRRNDRGNGGFTVTLR